MVSLRRVTQKQMQLNETDERERSLFYRFTFPEYTFLCFPKDKQVC
jgi:hypothetical protein